MNCSRNKKICLAASAGGHLSQLLKLSESWDGHETFFISTTEVMKEKLRDYGNVYIAGECNREHPFRVIAVFFRCLNAVLKEKPSIIISTGAAAGCMCCFIGKLLGAKIIWIDSITNVDKPSLSGRMVRFIADLFIVQWPELTERYKKAEYVGQII